MNDDAQTLQAALSLLARIREAAGDPKGKLMQDELVERIGRMREGLEQIKHAPTNQPWRKYQMDVNIIAKNALK